MIMLSAILSFDVACMGSPVTICPKKVNKRVQGKMLCLIRDHRITVKISETRSTTPADILVDI